MMEGRQKVMIPATSQIAPVADRRRRHRADQQVATNAPGIARRKRQDQNPEQIEPLLDPRRCAAQREHKSTDEIKHQQRIEGAVFSRRATIATTIMTARRSRSVWIVAVMNGRSGAGRCSCGGGAA
jgi:hypothetical protein